MRKTTACKLSLIGRKNSSFLSRNSPQKRIGFLCGINKPRKGREGLDYPLALITIKNTRAGFMARDL